jgi:hypothetical protein
VTRLGAIRGIATLTGFGLAVEIGDWDRFTGASIGAYLGLVPSKSSSGASRHQGSITKTGNTHARRLLVEAARPRRTPGHAGNQPAYLRLDHASLTTRTGASSPTGLHSHAPPKPPDEQHPGDENPAHHLTTRHSISGHTSPLHRNRL